jgi:hypothetical protein
VPTYMLAAYDSRTEVKEHADSVASGLGGDEESIQVAINAIASEAGGGAGRLVLAEGHFLVSNGCVITVPFGISIVGMGIWVTHVVYPAAGVPCSFVPSGENVFDDFTIREEEC